jgi:hypothetical protein
MEKDNEKSNILEGRFASNPGTKAGEERIMPKNQTNPIYRQLFKLVHPKIDSNNNYKSFSDFKPRDLR